MIAVTEKIVRFQTRRGVYLKILLGLAFMLPVLVLVYNWHWMSEKPIGCLVLFLPLSLFAWIYFDTRYIIRDHHLHYRSAFIRGTIDVNKIREITVGQTSWAGVRPATAPKGLLIKFNSFDEVYISPENDSQFVAELLNINHRIIVRKCD